MRALVPARSLALVGAIALLGGCGGYRSAYAARADGRARMGWAHGKLVARMPPNGVQLCYRENGPGGMTSPAPPPGWSGPSAPPSGPSGGQGREWVPYIGPSSGGSPGSMSKSGSGGGSSGKGEAAGLAVAILIIMPVVTAGLAFDPPGIDSRVARAMDDVNRHNDFMRRAAPPCAAVGVR